jgi:AcrR family transcriptional regulator
MRKSNAKQRILETASRLFHERGFSGVGINEIIEKADTAKATFYQHFPSKDALCAEWLDDLHARSEARHQAVLADPGLPAGKVDRYFASLADFLRDSDFRGCPYSNTGAVVDEDCRCIREQIEAHKLSIRSFFRRLATDIAPAGKRGEDLGDALFLLYSGATVEAQNLRALWPVDAAKRAARQLCQAAAGAA